MFQDKGGEKIDKVKENILETLVGNMTIVVIRARIKAIKEGGEAKDKGSKRGGKGTFRRKNSQRK